MEPELVELELLDEDELLDEVLLDEVLLDDDELLLDEVLLLDEELLLEEVLLDELLDEDSPPPQPASKAPETSPRLAIRKKRLKLFIGLPPFLEKPAPSY